MVSIRKMKQKYGGLICRACLNENYPKKYVHHSECLYTDLQICACCKAEKYLVRWVMLEGQIRMLLGRE